MKTFLTSTTLILIANMALADDFYGHFNNPDRDTTLNNGRVSNTRRMVGS